MATKKIRRICSYCLKKRYIEKMVLIYYPLIKKRAWHCKECFEDVESLAYLRENKEWHAIKF